jgi:3-methyladenine DNA glycosylase AlkD
LSRHGLGQDVQRVVEVCTRLARDREDMVVKAQSWALRELSKKHPEQARRFIAKHRKVLAARVVREVGNKLATGRKMP